MGYMQGVTKKGIDLVSRITGLLNQLTAEDFEGTYVTLRVSPVEEDLSREVGFWSNEYAFGDWAFFDGARKPEPLSVEEIEELVWNESSNNTSIYVSRSDSRNMALAVISLLKEKKLI